MGNLVREERAVEIVQMTNAEPSFYPTLGPFLARRAIAKELGGPLWDDDGMVWFVAFVPDHDTVMGFAALRPQTAAGVIWLDNTYVLPEWRERGVYRHLLHARLAACPPGATIRAVCTSKSLDPLQRRGFTVRRMRGQWAEVEWMKPQGQGHGLEEGPNGNTTY